MNRACAALEEAAQRLWSKLASKTLGVTATSRNWATVEALLKLASE